MAEYMDYIYLFFISMVPIVELRGAMPIAMGMDLPFFPALAVCVLGTLLRQAKTVTVTLLGEPDSGEEMFEASVETMEKLRRLAKEHGCGAEVEVLQSRDETALGHLEQQFFGENCPFEGDSSAIRILEADNVFSEVEQTAAEIRRLPAAGKCRCASWKWN